MSHARLSHPPRLLTVPVVILIGLTVSTAIAQAQSPTPEGALVDQTPRATSNADTPSPIPINGNRALSNQSIAGVEAPHGRAGRSWFLAEVRGGVATSASGDAEFGAVENPDRSSSAFVMSLGVCGPQSAILFTRRSGTPLGVGRYRISEGANGADEILALLLTGAPTRPTGVFRGQSGWLVVTATPDRFITGRFQLDATGFVAAGPRREDRHVSITGSFSATPASSSFRVCDDAE